MTPEQWARLKEVFQGALDQPPHARRDWLVNACAGDTTLLREADALLRAHDTAGDYLEEPARLDPADVDVLAPGSRIGTHYEIESVAGSGGMGIVYRARDTRLGRRVALKALPASVAANPELRERLKREARAAATISHRAVATVYALEEIDDQLFIASEYIAGRTLANEIASGPLPPARARAIAAEVARALCAAHDAGVVHRDLKPDNVLITEDAQVKVVDFGIAHIEAAEATKLTRAGAMLGTPAYMAPEQLLGGAIDARADIYAFGVMLSEMLTGRHPLRRGGSSDPPDVDPQLAAVAARSMQTNPELRFASARDLLAALEGRPEGRPLHDRERTTHHPPPTTNQIFWWQFHQAIIALAYWLMVYPAWRAREMIGGGLGRVFFIALLAAVIVGANVRLHLWFTSRFYPDELKRVRRRVGRWIRIADWAFAALLVLGGLYIGEDRSPLAVLLLSVGVGAAVAFLAIEPATTRAAFKGPSTPRPA